MFNIQEHTPPVRVCCECVSMSGRGVPTQSDNSHLGLTTTLNIVTGFVSIGNITSDEWPL